jgi:hypothetical protein
MTESHGSLLPGWDRSSGGSTSSTPSNAYASANRLRSSQSSHARVL